MDQVYAPTLQSGLASVASAVAARIIGEQPKLRVIEGASGPIDDTGEGVEKNVVSR